MTWGDPLTACLHWQAFPALLLAMMTAAATPLVAVAQSAPIPASAAAAAVTTSAATAGSDAAAPTLMLGSGDAISVKVFGRPELSLTTYIDDDGRVPVPLAGAVQVAGLSPAQAGTRIAQALREGQFLIDPQVTVLLEKFRSQQISVLGEVRAPGRFPVESKVNVIDLLALAGGTTDAGADVVYLLRPDGTGQVRRQRVDLRALSVDGRLGDSIAVQGGDAIFVPRADQFYIYGEVQNPNMYRLEPGMTLMQALSRGGGVTERGSHTRLEIRRRTADGVFVTLKAKPTDPVQADDVIRVKQRIF